MSVESITKSSPAAPGRGTGQARTGVHPPRQRTRPLTSGEPSARAAAAQQRARASRAWFLGIVLGLLGMGIVGLLLLNTASAQDAFRLHDLQTRAADLSRQEQALSMQASVLADPGTLAGRAGQLGMVPSGDPHFLAPGAALPAGCQPIADGCVVPGPKPAPRPGPQPSAQPSGNPHTPGKPAASPKPTASVSPAATSKRPAKPAASATVTPGRARPKAQPTPTPAPAPTGHRATRQTAAAASPSPTPAHSVAPRRGAG